MEDKIANDRHITVSRLAAETGLKRDTVHKIIRKDLKLTKKCAKYIPHELDNFQKSRRVEMCSFWNRLYLQQPRVFWSLVTMDIPV